jgi:signal transduction histidine kinase
MQGYFDPFIVCLSVLASILAVFVALDLTGRVAASGGTVRSAWIVAGALATGVGMWTMHFTGMLALHLPVAVNYTVRGMLLALAIAVAASIASLLVAATRGSMSLAVILCGCLLGIGMGGMHVVAMGAMRMAAMPVFDMRLIVLSMVIAIAASIALVSVASRLRSLEGSSGWRPRLAASLVIGGMIAVMHYTAMAGTTFEAAPMAAASSSAQVLATHGLAYTAIASCALMILLALGGSAVDRALQHRARLATEHGRLRAEAELARDQAQAANRAKSQFLAAMSHELRTPLNAIAGYTEILQLGVHGPLTVQQQDDVARIQRSQKHLLGLINDVLNFARLEAGKVRIKPQTVKTSVLLSTVEAMITPQVEAHGLRLVCEPAPEPVEVFCDPEKAEQVLLNLLSNAVKFTPRGGTIEVRSSATDRTAQISVRDSGVGIPQDKLETIFEPFVQVERNLTSPAEGAGLGLAISRDLARAMGGDLRVESTVGAGSVFTFELPLANDQMSVRESTDNHLGVHGQDLGRDELQLR